MRSTSADYPSRTRLPATVLLACYWLLMLVGTHLPIDRWRALSGEHRFLTDKWQHYLAYAVLGALLALWWSSRNRLTWQTASLLWGVVALYGLFDELTQPWFGRIADLLDWRADLVGSATGLGLFIVGRAMLGSRETCEAEASVS